MKFVTRFGMSETEQRYRQAFLGLTEEDAARVRESAVTLLQALLAVSVSLHASERAASITNIFSALMPQLREANRVYDQERKQSDALPHRRRDLEAAIATLQFGPLAPRVHAILDRHREAMPPVEEQDEADRVWRLSLHRMDLRRYSVAEEQGEAAPDETACADGGQRILLNLDIPDPDIKEMVGDWSPGGKALASEQATGISAILTGMG